MGVNKNFQGRNNQRSNNESKKAYQAEPPFRQVEGIESPAWDMLTPYGVWVLMELYRKFKGFNRYNLYLSYKEVEHKISNGTFNKSIWELIGYGFIDVKRFGQLEKNNSVYGLSKRWKKLGTKPRKLQEIARLLSHLNKVKRTKTPADLSSNERSAFRVKRRKMIRKLHNMILLV